MTRIGRWLTMGGYFGLLALFTSWFGWILPSPYYPKAMMLLVFVGPLLFALRGLLYGRIYTHQWLSMFLLVYLSHGIMEAWSRPDLVPYPQIEILLITATISGCVLYIRGRQAPREITSESTSKKES